jgi:glucose-6-phosphate 1-dehydrogenase
LSQIDDKFGQCSNKLFYLAVPPIYYKTIFTHLHASGLSKPCGGDLGWTRILVEKPFGNDLKSARSINRMLGKLFKEEQIFRIDHYLGKETIQDILTFRSNNQPFDYIWNGKYIQKIQASIIEERSVGSRGAFYDEVGALKDVGQNHLMQMIALAIMDIPFPENPKVIQKARESVIKNLKLAPKGLLVRVQYNGYLAESNVKPHSKTETYFKIQLQSKSKRWKGTEFIIESGKAFDRSEVRIDIYFRPAKKHLKCPPNVLTFFIQPRQGIELSFGQEKLSLAFDKEDKKTLDAYEKILYDCVLGDQTRFASTAEVELAWGIIMNILQKWQDKKIIRYPQGIAKLNFK